MRARAGRGRGALWGKAPPSLPCLALWGNVSPCDDVARPSARYARGSAAPLLAPCETPPTHPVRAPRLVTTFHRLWALPFARPLTAPSRIADGSQGKRGCHRAYGSDTSTFLCPDCPSSCRSPLPISTHSSKPQVAACRRVCSHSSTDAASVIAQPLSTPRCSHIQHYCPLLARPLLVDRAAFFALHPTTPGMGSKNAHAAVCAALYVTALCVTLLHNAVFLEHAPLGLCNAGAPRTLHYV